MVRIPSDFEAMLHALCAAARIQRPLVLHDKDLCTALANQGFVVASGSGYVGTPSLENLVGIPGAGRVIAAMLTAPPPAAALAFAAPAPVSAPVPAPILAEPGVAASFAPVAESVPIAAPLAPVSAPTTQPKRIEMTQAEKEILRHAQVLGVAIDSFRRELDQMLEVLRPHFEEVEDPSQREALIRALPPGKLRSSLELRQEAAGALPK